MKSRFVCLNTAYAVFCLFIIAFFTPSTALAKGKSIPQPNSYQVFTQRKGQSLNDAIKSLKLSSTQSKLVTSLPITKAARSDRQFHLGFVNGLLREIQVIRGKSRANFIIEVKKGKPVAKEVKKVAKPRALIAESKIVKSVTLNDKGSKNGKKSTKTAKKDKKTTKLFRQSFVQRKGQSLASVVNKQKLSKVQKDIILSLPISKAAKSNRTFYLGFEKDKGQKLLRSIKAVRGNSSAEYRIEVIDGKAIAVNATTGAKVARKESSDKSPSVDFGKYFVLRFTQKKGQSLSSVMRRAGLNSLQRKLVLKAPFTASAKSTRQFYVLMERIGKQKVMRSFKVRRGKSTAEYAVVKHKGKLEVADKNGNIEGGRSGMMRYPLNFSHVSSHFSYRRFHPILRRYRKHTGTDFAARRGTRIWAPASGVVTFRGWQRGYGKTVEINHGNGYKTKYAHLSRYAKGLRVGKRVSKKQIIAYVGNTGRSTGSHLHYEVIVNGRPRNPLRVALPGKNKKIRTKESRLVARKYLGKLNGMLSGRTRVAKRK